MKKLFLVLVAMVMSLNLAASPVTEKMIDESATWFCHIDLDVIRNSKLLLPFWSRLKNDFEFSKSHIDLEKLNSITFYSNSFEFEEDKTGIIIFKGNGLTEKLLIDTVADQDVEVKEAASISGKKVMEIVPRQSSNSQFVCFYSKETCILAGNTTSLTKAIAVFDGKTVSLTSEKLQASDSNIFQSRSMVQLPKSQAQAQGAMAMAQSIKSWNLALKDLSDAIELSFKADMDSAEKAGQSVGMLQMMIAGMAMQDPSKPLVDIANKLNFKVNGTTAVCSAKFTGADIEKIKAKIDKPVQGMPVAP